MTNAPFAPAEYDLVLEKTLDAPRQNIWRCWTEPELLKNWFCPKPWQTTHAEMDVRPGGGNRFTMRGPNGEKNNHSGIYLEVVPGERLVFTDAFTSGWKPSAKPFMTGVVTMEDDGPGRTRYVAIARHWTAEDKETHEKMGFHEGWGQAARQLEELARSL